VQRSSVPLTPRFLNAELLIYPSKDWSCSLDLAPRYNQYAKSDMPTVKSIRLNITERNVNKMTPNASMVIARTRIQRSGVEYCWLWSGLEYLSSLLLLPSILPEF